MHPQLLAVAMEVIQRVLLRVVGAPALRKGADEMEADLARTGRVSLTTAAKKAALLYYTAQAWVRLEESERLERLLRDYTSKGAESEVVAALAGVMLDLASLDEGEALNEDVAHRQKRLWLAIAAQLSGLGHPSEALQTASIAVNLAGEPGAERLAVAEFMMAIAADVPGPDLARCAVEVATSRIAMAEAAPDERAAAFDASLQAIELLVHADRAAVRDSARVLATRLHAHPWCDVLTPQLLRVALDEARLEELNKRVPQPDWPERTTRTAGKVWSETMASMMQGEFRRAQEIDQARLALDPNPPETASMDFLAQDLDHPAYRRAVPQHLSFMREAEFPTQVLVLAHETTHALSLIGVLGGVSCVLRSAMVTAAARAASLPSAAEDASGARMPAVGDARGLADIETLIETGLKLRALHDAWTPWLEGLAVFAETAADPAMEESRINPVLSCLRNLVDVPANDAQDMRAGLEALVAEFEAAVSGAMRDRGRDRLNTTLAWTAGGDPYLPGYLAVRAVVAAWRRTRGAAIDAGAAFIILLHATRFALRDIVPSLAMPSEQFAAEVRDGMARFAARLAALDAAGIETFQKSPARDEAGPSISWIGGRPSPVADGEALEAEADAYHAAAIRAALLPRRSETNLAQPGRSDPLAERATAALAEWWSSADGEELAEEAAQLARRLFEQGCLLPVGRCDASFAANCPPDGGVAYLTVQLRTTERLAGADHPSYNIIALPVTAAEFDAIEAVYRRTGAPRMRVTRVIDLGRVLSAELPDLHVLVFQYGEATLVRTTTMVIDFARAAASTGRPPDYLTSVLGARVAEVGRAQLARATDIAAHAQRTLAWLDAADAWRANDTSVPAADWAAKLRARAAPLADPAAHRAAQREAAEALLQTLWPGAAEGSRLASHSFRDLTEGGDRSELVRSLLDTARRPVADDGWLDANATRAAASGFDVFARGALGWDVRPAAALAES